MTDQEKRKSELAAMFMAAMLSNAEVILAIGKMPKEKQFDLFLTSLADCSFDAANEFLAREKKETTKNKK